MPWHQLLNLPSAKFKCGHCGYIVANDKGYCTDSRDRCIYICPHCENPTFITELGLQIPGSSSGNAVQHVPKELDSLYSEARNCCSVSAFTSSVLASRKMLMNIAVQQGAKEGLKFIEYIEYLAANGFIPPNGRSWVDHIRKKGNEATHEISLMDKSDADELIIFIEMLLKFIYEFPHRVPSTSRL